jgi:hypothetical protein
MDNVMTIQEAIIKVSSGYIGIKEISGNKGWKNKDYEKKMKDMGWRSGQSWCMYAVKLVLFEAYTLIGDEKMAQWVKTTLNGGVLSSYAKLKSKGVTHAPTEAKPGMIGIMRNGSSELGHAFIVERINSRGDIVTNEGNTDSGTGVREGDGYYRRTRYTTSMLANKLHLIAYVELR